MRTRYLAIVGTRGLAYAMHLHRRHKRRIFLGGHHRVAFLYLSVGTVGL